MAQEGLGAQVFVHQSKSFMKVTTRGDPTYEQHDMILKPKHLRLQALLVILDDTTFLWQICEDLKKILLLLASKVN